MVVICTDLARNNWNRRRDESQPSPDVWQRIRRWLGLLAYLRQQEGVAQVKVNSQRALFLRYQELVESDLKYLTSILSARETAIGVSSTLLADAGSQFMLDKAHLLEQAKLLHDVESILSGIKHRMTEIDEKLEVDFNSVFAAAGPWTSCEVDRGRRTSNGDADIPTLVSEYFHKMQEIAVLDDRLIDLALEHEEQLRGSSDGCGSQSRYESRKAALETQTESLRAESINLKDRCIAQGRDPEMYRCRRSSSCSASDVSFIDCDSLVAYDEELDAIRIT